MLDRDLADSSLASCPAPDMAAGDTLLDVFREIVSTQFPGSFKERTEQQYELLMKELKDHGSEIETPKPILSSERELIVFETLRFVYGNTSFEPEIRNMAAAALAGMNRISVSYQAISDEFGSTRACTHLHSRRFERRTGIRPRRAKSDKARVTCQLNTQGKRKQGGDDESRYMVGFAQDRVTIPPSETLLQEFFFHSAE